MDSISGFLHKFLNLEKNNTIKLTTILEIIKEETSLELQKDVLEIKGDNLKINCSPLFRNEIFMHKSQIEESLRLQKIFLKLV
jgi:hypothetical protein